MHLSRRVRSGRSSSHWCFDHLVAVATTELLQQRLSHLVSGPSPAISVDRVEVSDNRRGTPPLAHIACRLKA